MTTHRHTKTPEYRIWEAMKKRCRNSNDKRWNSYGGRGIRVCDRWEFFENFIADMGWRPEKGYSLDRIDNDGDYTPENCRWATIYEQNNNRTNNIRIEHEGRTLTLTQWANLYGVHPVTAKCRLQRGLAFTEAFYPGKYKTGRKTT